MSKQPTDNSNNNQPNPSQTQPMVAQPSPMQIPAPAPSLQISPHMIPAAPVLAPSISPLFPLPGDVGSISPIENPLPPSITTVMDFLEERVITIKLSNGEQIGTCKAKAASGGNVVKR